jgi:hypothetical protein
MCGLRVDYGKRQGVFVKLEFSWINRNIFVLNNRWTRSMACGPCSAMVHSGPAMDGGTKLAPVSKGVGQRAEEGEWNAGNPMVRSPELRRQ